jgi:GNAT superfamily N-acetyltransferase
MLPNFDYERIHDWHCTDRFRFEREDVAKTWTDSDSGFTFYKLVYTDASAICEKVVVFDGNFRVGYVTWSATELCGLYVMPNYRGRGVAKKLLSYAPPGLYIWIQDFTLTESEPAGLDYDGLHRFYQVHYYEKKENHGNQHRKACEARKRAG